jgi:hypothetical protein
VSTVRYGEKALVDMQNWEPDILRLLEACKTEVEASACDFSRDPKPVEDLGTKLQAHFAALPERGRAKLLEAALQ